jgi:hypothetical protein
LRADGFSSVRNRRSARTGRRPRKLGRHNSKYRPTPADVGKRALRAPRASHVFGTDEKHIRTENMVIDKSNNGLGLLLSKIVDCARMCFSSVRHR